MAMMSGGGGGRGGRRAPMAEINVTPLVDVMLVLLIIFMVTAPLLTAGVQVQLPESRAGAIDHQQKPVEISIDDKGQIFVDKDQVSDAALPDRLQAIAAEPSADGGPRQVFLRADRGLDYGHVMRVMGELNRAGLNKVALLSDPRNEG